MDNQNDWIDQQYVANEAASILERLSEENEFTRLKNKPMIEAALTMLREVILNQYGLSKEDLLTLWSLLSTRRTRKTNERRGEAGGL